MNIVAKSNSTSFHLLEELLRVFRPGAIHSSRQRHTANDMLCQRLEVVEDGALDKCCFVLDSPCNVRVQCAYCVYNSVGKFVRYLFAFSLVATLGIHISYCSGAAYCHIVVSCAMFAPSICP